MLELSEMKVSRGVFREEGGVEASDLPDQEGAMLDLRDGIEEACKNLRGANYFRINLKSACFINSHTNVEESATFCR